MGPVDGRAPAPPTPFVIGLKDTGERGGWPGPLAGVVGVLNCALGVKGVYEPAPSCEGCEGGCCGP